ncbi:hypothetical protein, variant [Exophiala mesophila]|uniref:Uncharacterized protein n=1 Tax=Exophiala mesophila TaxID=212818 RepID=A0A0D1XWJ8_EXOME|nr:hypothetical protein, variant [Exophiala mesophila]KIV92566.1 hypothetical protein, variant [Exophiala mesophila]
MNEVIAQYRGTSNFSVISQSALESAKKPALHHDQLHHVALPVAPRKGHAALVVIAIQPLTNSEWPGCVFFGVAIKAVHCCCRDVLNAVCEQAGMIIGRVYTQITVDILKTVKAAQVIQLPVACPVPLQFLDGTSLGKDSIAKGYAETLSKKIKSGIEKIKKSLKKGSSIIDLLTGKTSKPVCRRQVDTEAAYDVIVGSFLEDAQRYQEDITVSNFRVWCANFSAGALDSIADFLPRRSVAHSITQVSTRAGATIRKHRQRRRDLARVANTIVYRLPSHPRLIYAALGVKNYYFVYRDGLSDAQLDSIVSWVLVDLKEEDLTILDKYPDIYGPVQAIGERTGLSNSEISKALFENTSQILSQVDGKGQADLENESENGDEESDFEDETEEEVTENGEICSSFTPRTSFSSSRTSPHNSNCFSDTDDPTFPQPAISNMIRQGDVIIPDPVLGRVDELLAAAALRGMVDESTSMSMTVSDVFQNCSTRQPPVDEDRRHAPGKASQQDQFTVGSGEFPGLSHAMNSGDTRAFGSPWVSGTASLDQSDEDHTVIIDSSTSIAGQRHIITPSTNILSVPMTMTSTSISNNNRENSDSGPVLTKRRRVDADTADGDPGLMVPYIRPFNDITVGNPISNELGASNNILHTATYTSFGNFGPVSEHSLSAQLSVHGEQLCDHSTESSASGPEDSLLGGRNESTPNWQSMFEHVESLCFEGEPWNPPTADWIRMFEQVEKVNFEEGFIENDSELDKVVSLFTCLSIP